ncbi:MAG: hypothetical protein KDH94_06185, partial [Coxiellaceae bacterium]|nr:hypothetical protein [Coxiellaceae bacterium]
FTMDGSVVHYQDKSGRLQSANEINLTEYPKFVCDLLSKYGPEYSYEKIDVYDLFGVRDNPLDARNVFLYMYFLRSKDSVVHVVYDELKTSLGEQHELLRQAKASINALDKRIDDEKEAFGSRDEQHQWSREIHKNVVNLRTALAQFSEFKPGAGIVGGVFGLLSSSSAKANLARDAEGLLGRELYAAISPYVDITQANDGILQWALVATFEHLSEELDGITQKFHDRYQKEKQQHGENAVGKALEAYIDAAKATCTYQAYQDGESDLAVTEGFGY